MKKIIILIGMSLCLSAIGINTQGQLLKKLKDKVQKPAESKTNSENQAPAANNQTNNENNSSPSAKIKWQPTPDCDKLFSLEKGETFFYDETKVFTANGKISTAFIVMNSRYEYFLIEDGKRTGPFKEPPVKEMFIISDKAGDEAGNSDDEKIEMAGGEKDPVAQQFCKTISNKLYIVFNGKNFGPYDFVAKMKVSPDKKKFWAAVTIGGVSDMVAKMGMGNCFLVNEAGVKQKGGDQNSFPAKMIVSNNFSAAALSILDNAGQKAITVSSTGKKQEGNMMDLYADNKSGMAVADNGDIISVPPQSPTQVLVNGTEAASFKVPITSLRRLFILPDYRKSVYYQSGKLYRGDGSEEALTGVTFPKFVMLNNQPVMCYYKIHQTETDSKDVYLCKKTL
jgi:hypothetical protein